MIELEKLCWRLSPSRANLKENFKFLFFIKLAERKNNCEKNQPLVSAVGHNKARQALQQLQL
jgi:hypothetical protein